MRGDVFQRADGGVSLQVAGGGAQHQPRACQALRDQAGVGQACNADGKVIPFIDQVHHAVGQGHVQADLRVLLQEAAPQRRQVQVAEGHRGIDAQAADRLHGVCTGGGVGFGQIVEDLEAALGIRHTGFGQRLAARGAVEQAHAQARLQFQHQARHHGLGATQPLARLHKAAALHDGNKGFHLAKLVHGGLGERGCRG